MRLEHNYDQQQQCIRNAVAAQHYHHQGKTQEHCCCHHHHHNNNNNKSHSSYSADLIGLVQERNLLEGQLVQQLQWLKQWAQHLSGCGGGGKQMMHDLNEKLQQLLHNELPAIAKALGSQKNLPQQKQQQQQQQAYQMHLTPLPDASTTPSQLIESLASLQQQAKAFQDEFAKKTMMCQQQSKQQLKQQHDHLLTKLGLWHSYRLLGAGP